MPRTCYDDDIRVRPRERMPPVTLDWIDGKNVKLLQVANHREAFRFKKLNQALSSIENLNKSRWLREERKVKQNLRRLASVSPAYRSQTLFQRPSEDFLSSPGRGGSRMALPASPLSRGGLIEAPSPLSPSRHQRTAPSIPRPSQRGLIVPTTPQSDPPFFHHPGNDSRDALSASTSSCWGGRYVPPPQRPSQDPSTLSLLSQDPPSSRGGSSTPLLATPSILALLPPQLSPELHGLQEAVLGFPLLQRRVRELLTCARATEQQRQAQRSITLRPLEALRCRYLRLSESNITRLLELCKESGIHVDIHAHMKDSDIDVTKLFQSSSPAASPSSSTDIL